MHGHHVTTTPTSSSFTYPQQGQSQNQTSSRMGTMVASSSVSEINSIILSHSPQPHQIYGAGPSLQLQRNQPGASGVDPNNFRYSSGYTISPSSTKSVMSKVGKIEPLKTPVSLLNEICTKAQISPQFETAETGPPHDRVFECIVKLERQGMKWEGQGQARAKKDARQEAAKALLLSMDEQVEKLLVPSKTDEVDHDQQKSNLVDCDPDVEGNPVGELNDLCMRLKRQPPEYEDIETEGKPHESVHIVACKLGSQCIEQGRGRTKKHAKKVAAHKVKQNLTAMMLASGDGSQDDAKDSCIIQRIQALTMGSKKSPKKDNNDTFKLGEWLACFRERSGEKLTSLQDHNKATGSDSAKLLREIAEEQKFKVEYFDVEKPVATSEGGEEFASIMSIGIEPVAIFLGTGGSKTQARKSAALKAVEFLKIAIMK